MVPCQVYFLTRESVGLTRLTVSKDFSEKCVFSGQGFVWGWEVE